MATQSPQRRPLRRGEGPTGAELKALYDAGVSVRAIARALGGWPYTTVHSRLKMAGTQFRARGGRRAPDSQVRTDYPDAAQ